MAFEKHKTGEEFVSVRIHGHTHQFYFSSQFAKSNKLDDYSSVDIFIDKDKQRIEFRFNKKIKGMYKLYEGSHGAYMIASNVIQRYGIKKGRYPLTFDKGKKIAKFCWAKRGEL